MLENGVSDPRIVVALDYADAAEALELVEELDPGYCRLKVGKELFTRGGPALVERLVNDDFDVFLDLKFHDIPNTVAQACAAAADLGVWMVNVHALGGRRMMEAACDAVERAAYRPLLIGVTILTSMDENDVREIGLPGTPRDNVLRLAALAQQSGLDGVVCSSQEVLDLRQAMGEPFGLVTPGIRPRGAQADDQKRIMTPYDAIRNGSDYLVIGRPITMADDPMRALLEIQAEIDAALGEG
ncbi:MAG: orotidine-5'-phosphate decarboxylase [Gammaproteobacteria bacterium]|nr:orotidine-5'-phosphate decarboxylase [Gammaproteobacteria bacterium]